MSVYQKKRHSFTKIATIITLVFITSSCATNTTKVQYEVGSVKDVRNLSIFNEDRLASKKTLRTSPYWTQCSGTTNDEVLYQYKTTIKRSGKYAIELSFKISNSNLHHGFDEVEDNFGTMFPLDADTADTKAAMDYSINLTKERLHTYNQQPVTLQFINTANDVSCNVIIEQPVSQSFYQQFVTLFENDNWQRSSER